MTVALAATVAHDCTVLLLLIGVPSLVLLFTLALALYLTAIELRELRLHWKWWAWWFSVVLLLHFVGYLALRGYAVYRRRYEARA